ncbi:MAG: hypothetical protein Q9163_000998 [Psora crenata]
MRFPLRKRSTPPTTLSMAGDEKRVPGSQAACKYLRSTCSGGTDRCARQRTPGPVYGNEANLVSKGDHAGEGYCNDRSHINQLSGNDLRNDGVSHTDIEKGTLPVEHVILSVQGMTCSGCERKLYRSLQSIPSITNVKTSIALAQAEFDFCGSFPVDVVRLIQTVERMTGFSCYRMAESEKMLDLIISGQLMKLIHEKALPLGVTGLTVLDKKTIRVAYDATKVGARELLYDPVFSPAKLAPLAAQPAIASSRAHVRKTLAMTLLSVLLTMPVLVLSWAPLPKHEALYGTISLTLATAVQTAIAGPFYLSALQTLIFTRMIEMDFLIVLSTTAAYVYSVVAYAYLAAGKPLSTGGFFETSTLLVTLIMVGRTISAFARQKAVESISIESLQTPKALLVDTMSRQTREIDARLLQYHDTFQVLPHMSIVTDGIVTAGKTDVDESFITGEATLIFKKPGMPVIAGSINHSGTIEVRLTRLPSENTITTIRSLVDESLSSKPNIQQIADRFASCFVPIILLISMVIFISWAAVETYVRKQPLSIACVHAMTYSISVLIISCPCAVGLAVPMVMMIAGGVGARNGLICRAGETLEKAQNISHVVFDKTGTLTQGNLSVAVEHYVNDDPGLLAAMVLGMTMNSKHPVSNAITAHMKTLDIQASRVTNFVSEPGKGIRATWNGRTVHAGNPHWLGFQQSPLVQAMIPLGLTVFCASIDGRLAAAFGLKDTLRPDAIRTIQQLRDRSIEISLVSGDNEAAVNSIAKQLSIPQSHVRSRCSPAEKQLYVKNALMSGKEMQKKKKKKKTEKKRDNIVLFCGDGTNDAPALAQASIGLHMNEGTDIAQSAADAILMRSSLSGILTLIDLSRAAHRRVVFNFVWAAVYNLFAILLAAGAFPKGVRIPPHWAGLGEIVSVVPVIAVAVGLKWVKLERVD